MRPSSRPNILFDPTSEWFTWLPYADFVKTFEFLDPYRLGRTMFESGSVLDSLVGVGRDTLWKRHTASRLWRGYESALAFYVSLSVREMHIRGFRTIRIAPYDIYNSYTIEPLFYGHKNLLPLSEIVYPPWLGDERLHSSHRAGLLKLEPKFYAQHEWTESPDIPIYWPEGINDGFTDNDTKPRKIAALAEINAEMDP